MTDAGAEVLVCDYGGVLTNPLMETFTAFAETSGLSLELIGSAFAAATQLYGVSPMAALEVAEITEQEFVDRIAAALPARALPLLSVLDGRSFGELWFRGRTANSTMLDLVRAVRGHGLRTALLTNNVREWGPLWRATLPVDELFEVVVDSSEEKVRKPDPEIYRILLDRLGAPAERCLLLDDTEENCVAARELGMRAVLFRDDAQAAAELRAAFGLCPVPAAGPGGGS